MTWLLPFSSFPIYDLQQSCHLTLHQLWPSTHRHPFDQIITLFNWQFTWSFLLVMKLGMNGDYTCIPHVWIHGVQTGSILHFYLYIMLGIFQTNGSCSKALFSQLLRLFYSMLVAYDNWLVLKTVHHSQFQFLLYASYSINLWINNTHNHAVCTSQSL
jgi:hypothetical protein